MNEKPLMPNDDLLLLQIADLLAVRLRQLLNQGIVSESSEQVRLIQNKIDRLRQQLERLRVALRQARERSQRRRSLEKGSSRL